MKGQFIHNQIMAATIEAALQFKGYRIFREFPIQPGQRPPSVDLACEANGRFIVFEIERTTARVGNDVHKAERIGAHLLIIVVTTSQLRERVRASLIRFVVQQERVRIQVMTLGAALQWIASNCPIASGGKAISKNVSRANPPLNTTKGITP